MRITSPKSLSCQTSRPFLLKQNPEQVGQNILNREFFASNPNEKWLSDVTEFKYGYSGQKFYLCAILDLYDNSIYTHTS